MMLDLSYERQLKRLVAKFSDELVKIHDIYKENLKLFTFHDISMTFIYCYSFF